MEKYYTDESFLARWISGDLSEEERVAFEKTDAFKQFSIINREAQLLDGPVIDTEAALEKVNRKLNNEQSKPKVRRLRWLAAAASIAVIFGLFTFFNATKTYTTGIGEKQTIALADGSVIELNANSSLSHKRFSWLDDKQVHLKGEGFFSIIRGEGFKVNTSKGLVSVLGTKFNIYDRSSFEIKCYEGSVGFDIKTASTDTQVLTKGMMLDLENDIIRTGTFSKEIPYWKQGYSSFIDQPLSEVLAEFENQFPVKFIKNDVDTNRLFTGQFGHDDMNKALQTTLAPMGIKYTISSDKKSITLVE